jgi:protein SCO1
MRGPIAVALSALLLAAGTLAPAAARGDGDPASDVLVSQALFLPYDTGVSSALQARLEALLKLADRAGVAIRVALIPNEYDLGSVGVLWHDPRTYARFLGIELSLTYGQRLLVVMPNGFGFNWPHHGTAAAYGVLGKVKIASGGSGLVAATETAIERLAAAAGVDLSRASRSAHETAATHGAAAGAGSQAPASGTGGARTDERSALIHILFALFVLASAIALAASVLIVLRNEHRAQRAARTDSGADPVSRSGSRLWDALALRRARWAVGGTAALCVCVAVAVALLAGGKPGGASAGTRKSAAGEAPTMFAQGQRPAPNFELSDQQGHSVSLAAYRGRPVIVTFIDPLCRNLCPLAAKILSEADRHIPPARRPQIIAVSVDVYADTRSDLREDFRRWSLVPQWQWAVGAPRQLETVWKRYYAEVEVETKRIAGTTVHYVTHSEMAYLIDGQGYERALFSWPFTRREVEATVRRLTRS